MTIEQQLLEEFKMEAQKSQEEANIKFEERIEELKLNTKTVSAPRNWNLKPNFSLHISDVTPEGYGI